VSEFRFSQRADDDLFNIADYTLRTWGKSQTHRYLSELEKCFRLLASNPGLGRACDSVLAGVRRMEKGRHVIFFREEAGGILVCRILHQGMLPGEQTFDDE
jgi:toxin ParE1/3/4